MKFTITFLTYPNSPFPKDSPLSKSNSFLNYLNDLKLNTFLFIRVKLYLSVKSNLTSQ